MGLPLSVSFLTHSAQNNLLAQAEFLTQNEFFTAGTTSVPLHALAAVIQF
jgi:hypothetical protein